MKQTSLHYLFPDQEDHRTTLKVHYLRPEPDRVKQSIDRLPIPLKEGIRIIELKDIIYLKAEGNYVEIFTSEAKYLLAKTLKYFNERLCPSTFIRIHQSYLVHQGQIEFIRTGNEKSVILKDQTVLPISRSQYSHVKSTFLQHFNI